MKTFAFLNRLANHKSTAHGMTEGNVVRVLIIHQDPDTTNITSHIRALPVRRRPQALVGKDLNYISEGVRPEMERHSIQRPIRHAN